MNSLPKGWTITRYPGQLELRDEHGTTKAWIPAPNTPMTIGEMLDAAAQQCYVNLDHEEHGDSGAVSVAEGRECDLADYARVVLEILANEPEWSSDTVDRLANEAIERNLATTDDDGMFTLT